MYALIGGAHVERFDSPHTAVFSPRVAFLVKPGANQTIRLSYNRAYRSPSVINNFLDITIAEPLNLGAFDPRLNGRIYPIPIHAGGNSNLKKTSLDAYEIGYSGVVAQGHAIVSAALYVDNTKEGTVLTAPTAHR